MDDILIKLGLAFGTLFIMFNIAGLLTWVERKQSAVMQDRIGANRAKIFGFKALGIISGVLVFSNNLGGAGGPPFTGAIFDSTGSYFSAFLICGILGLAAGFIVFLLKPLAKT